MAVSVQHTNQCPICNSDKLEEINDLIEDWWPATEIHQKHIEFSEHTILNHEKSTGLRKKKLKNKQRVLQKIVERGMEIMKTRGFKLDAGHVTKAIELLGKMNKAGQIVDKQETKLSGEINIKKEVDKQVDNLKSAIGVDNVSE